jgi:endogenous inhibitor of DNA gyrase (YacG/DUF329 family)
MLECPECNVRFELIVEFCSMMANGFDRSHFCPFCGAETDMIDLEAEDA